MSTTVVTSDVERALNAAHARASFLGDEDAQTLAQFLWVLDRAHVRALAYTDLPELIQVAIDRNLPALPHSALS